MPGPSKRRFALLAWLSAASIALALTSPWVGTAGAAPSRSAVQAATDATTGLADAAAVRPTGVCPAAPAGGATCYAQALAYRAGGGFVHPRLAPAPLAARTAIARDRAAAAAPFASPSAVMGAPQAGTPAYLQQAYDLSYLSQTAGGAQTVAIVDAYDDPSAEADLNVYRAQFGLPPCTTSNGCFRKANQTGGTSYPAADSGWAVEISLDLDAVSALCPQCHIVLVEATSPSFSDLAAAQAEAHTLGANIISDSWGGTASSQPAGQYTFPGVVTVAAAGDNGYDGAGRSDYPAAITGVTAAGGTTLLPASPGQPRGYAESAWSGAGSGCDLTQPKPAWQSDSGCTGRAYADLSAEADPNTGMQIYDSGDRGWMVVGGTSEASPLIAAFYAVTGAAAQSGSWPYDNRAALNDPSGGSNGACAAAILYICNGGVGYDGPTGAGSISGAVAAGAPGVGGPGAAGNYTTSVTGTAAQLQAGIFPNGSDTSWWVQYGTSTDYGQQTPAGGIGRGSAPVPVTGALTGLVADTTYHYRLVAQNGYGTTYGYDYSFTTGAPSAPIINSVSAAPGSQSATLSGAIDPGGAAATYRFLYGPTANLTQSTATQVTTASGVQAVSAALGGLTPATTYYYEMLAGNAGGTTPGPVLSFRTTAAPASAASGGARATIASAGAAIGRLTWNGTNAAVVISCRAASACRVRVQLSLGGHVLAASTMTVGAHRTSTVRLRLTRRNAAFARRHGGRPRVVLLQSRRGHFRLVAQKTLAARRTGAG